MSESIVISICCIVLFIVFPICLLIICNETRKEKEADKKREALKVKKVKEALWTEKVKESLSVEQRRQKCNEMIERAKREREERELREKIDSLFNNSLEVTPEEFFDLRNQSLKSANGDKLNTYGVYIIYNKSKDMYYIGQSKNIMNRVNNHFTGKGNGDVYADYKYGDKFSIKLLSLENSGYKNLNDFERDTIQRYSKKYKLYNKTKGNK